MVHSCSSAHWHVIVKTCLRIKCLYGEFLAKVLNRGVHTDLICAGKVSGLGRCLDLGGPD